MIAPPTTTVPSVTSTEVVTQMEEEADRIWDFLKTHDRTKLNQNVYLIKHYHEFNNIRAAVASLVQTGVALTQDMLVGYNFHGIFREVRWHIDAAYPCPIFPMSHKMAAELQSSEWGVLP